MTQTRGRRFAQALRSGSGKGRGIRIAVDEKNLKEIWESKGKKAPEGLVEKIIDLAAGQDALEATEMKVLESGSELLNAIRDVEKSATQLRKKLRAMQGLEDGNLHLFKWLLKYANKLPAKYSSYPESFLVEMLGELANAQARHYQKVSPAGHWYEFINELRRAFEEFGEKVCATDKSIFGGTLIELDRQFPGLVFPPQSVGNEERRSYVRRAFNNRNRSQD